jgi:hypothetical protein
MEAIMKFDPENSSVADELFAIMENPAAHIDLYTEVERMGQFAYARGWKEGMCPYFKETTLENKFRRTWNEVTGTIQERETFTPAKSWLIGWRNQQVDSMVAACSDLRLKW